MFFTTSWLFVWKCEFVIPNVWTAPRTCMKTAGLKLLSDV